RELALAKRFASGCFSIYGLGFIGYSLLPAAGPWKALATEFREPLTGGWLTDLNMLIVSRGSNGVDVFPSLHCAVSAFFLCFDCRHRPLRFRILLLPCVGLWISTIYLRYHYAVDVVAGFVLAAFGWWIANRTLAKPVKLEKLSAPPLP